MRHLSELADSVADAVTTTEERAKQGLVRKVRSLLCTRVAGSRALRQLENRLYRTSFLVYSTIIAPQYFPRSPLPTNVRACRVEARGGSAAYEG